MDKKIYSVADISKICKVKENTVRVWIRDGQLIACKDEESRRYYISWREFQNFLADNKKYAKRADNYGQHILLKGNLADNRELKIKLYESQIRVYKKQREELSVKISLLEKRLEEVKNGR